MIQLIADREHEFRFLEQHYKRRTSELVVIYGRRRAGKTELALQFSKDKPHVYFLVDRRPENELIQGLKQRMSFYLKDESFQKLAVKDWFELFQEFTKWNRNEHTIVILDEFPNLVETSRAAPSIFQKIWDQNLKSTKTMLILLGSSIAVMENEVLGYKSPLYGRRTAQWKLEPLKIHHLRPFFTQYSIEQLTHVYACIGGIPFYLLKFDPQLDFWQNVEQKILTKGEFLYEEAEFLLREELREPRNYNLILRVLAQGARTYGEILNQTNMDKSMLSKYTSVLEDLGFIERTYPIAIKPKPRKGVYTIADNYLNFWFRYVFPNKTELETCNTQDVLSRIKRDYNTYLGRAFEQAATEFLTEMKSRNKLPFTFTTIGKWWCKGDEIGIVALDEETKTATFLEAKWSTLNKQDCNETLRNLEEKAQRFRWNHKKENYGIIAKRITHKQDLTGQGCIVFDLDDLEPLMTRNT